MKTGILSQAQNASKNTEIGKFLEEANLVYTEIYSEKAQNGEYSVYKGEVATRLKNKYGYGNRIRGISNLEATDIEVSESETIEEEETKILSVTKTEEASGEVETYYVEIQGIWYPINQNNKGIILGESVSELPTAESLSQQFTATSQDNSIVTAEAIEEDGVLTVTIVGQSLTETSTATIEVKYGNITKNISVTVKKIYTVTVQSNDTTKGTVNPTLTSQKYAEGSSIVLEALPKTGNSLLGWYDGNTLLSKSKSFNYSVSGDITITADFEASQSISSLRTGNEVIYTDNNGNEIPCIVLYDSTGSYGTQIISKGTVGNDIELGNGYKEINGTGSTAAYYHRIALNSYNTAVAKLNTAAGRYLNEELAISARCVGSSPSEVPVTSESNSGSRTSTFINFSPYNNNEFKESDNNVSESTGDYMQMKNVNCINAYNQYWLASRYETENDTAVNLCIRVVLRNRGNLSHDALVFANSRVPYSYSFTYGLRPVFTLKSDINYIEKNSRKILVQ